MNTKPLRAIPDRGSHARAERRAAPDTYLPGKGPTKASCFVNFWHWINNAPGSGTG
jgi:hypothetical protein